MTRVGMKLPRRADSPRWTFGQSAADWARQVEAAGYDSLWVAEGWGDNAFVALAEVAGATTDLRFGTAIVNVYSRSPAVLAMGAASLARRSDGRAILGLGASHDGLVEGLHDVPYERPVRRSHETIELVRALTGDGDPVEYAGEVFDVEWTPPLDAEVPIYNAAMGPANRRATGRVADGWLPYMIPISRLEAAAGTVAAGAREAGRDPDAVAVTPQILAVVDDDPAAAREPIRRFVGTYVGSYENYRSITAEDFPEETAAIVEAWEAGDEATAIERVTDEMVEEFGVAGSPDAARAALRDVTAIDAVDEVLLYPPPGLDRETFDRTIEALGPTAL